MFQNKFIVGLITTVLLIIVCLPVVLPYLHPGYFPTHDGEWAVVRLADMFRTLKDLQFPPRYSGALNFGYGYPLFNFTYPFPYYLGIIFYFPFHSFVTSIKIMFVLSVFLSAIFMYKASGLLWKSRIAGFVSAVLYVYLPYRMVDLFVRGSLGESLSFALFPLIFYLTIKLFDNAYSRATVFLLSLTIGILVMTHNIMTVLFLPILIVFTLTRIFKEKKYGVLQSFILSLFLGAGLSFFFWFPALFEKGNILLSRIPIADRSLYFINPSQLLMPSWGYAPPTEVGGFSYQLGIAQIMVILMVLGTLSISFIKSKFTLTPAKFYVLIFLIIYIVSLIMMFSFSGFVWKLPLLKEINYPWTLLSQLGFITALLAGFLTIQFSYLRYLLYFICAIAIISVFVYAHPKEFVNRGDNFYLTNEATTTSSQELMPLWVKDFPKEHFKDKVEVLNGSATITSLQYNSRKIIFNYKTDSPVTFRINTIYFPGWKAYINNEPVKIDYKNPKGVMDINASQYRDTIEIAFGETLPRMLADVISVVCLIVLLFIILRPILLFKS